MLFVLNGQTYNTDQIFSIEEVTTEVYGKIAFANFTIHFFEDKHVPVRQLVKTPRTNLEGLPPAQKAAMQLVQDKELEEARVKLTAVKEAIEKLWQDNPSKVPHFKTNQR